MKSKDLKITAGYIVTESKLSKAAKLQLLNFIQKEASDEQLMALLLDGKITKLDEQAKEIINNRFQLSEVRNYISKIKEKVEKSKKTKK